MNDEAKRDGHDERGSGSISSGGGATGAAAQTPDHHAMRLAIEASTQALRAGDMPFGATLAAPDGRVLMVARNNQVTRQDCTGHAELVLVREASHRLGPAALRGATVFASGEPCAMCCGALFWAGVARVVFAATQADIAEALGDPVLPMTARQVLAGARPAIDVQGPFMRDEAVAALLDQAS